MLLDVRHAQMIYFHPGLALERNAYSVSSLIESRMLVFATGTFYHSLQRMPEE
jgi:hypothetical protein